MHNFSYPFDEESFVFNQVGFEAVQDDRAAFYQISQSLDLVSSGSHHLYATPPDEEGFCIANEGVHTIPFALALPIGGGAKGILQGRSPTIRYIILALVTLR